ncbi:MAG: sugar transferase [Chitinophagales bacterium]|nr:sugar transferase [Chitinophagales bacterium]MDW8417974.1 sugar transferase [Chitinophagales bacterium]
MKQRRRYIYGYAAGDALAAAASWYGLFLFRKSTIEQQAFDLTLPFSDHKFIAAVFVVPLLWLVLHYITGTYTDIFKKSRLQELGKTALVSLFGAIVLFFTFLLDDYIRSFKDYYLTFFVLFFLHFTFTGLQRLAWLTYAKHRLRTGKDGFTTIIIGSNRRANEIYEEMKTSAREFGWRFAGYVETNGKEDNTLTRELPMLGTLDKLEDIIAQIPDTEEVIIAIESSEHPLLNQIINRLADKYLTLRIIPDMYDILSGTVKMNHVIGEAFIEIRPELISEWERITKRWFDVAASAAAILFTLPLWIYVMWRIKRTDGGDIFYRQERLGQYARPFIIYKFRSMYPGAENNGPQLTVENDPRITPIGRWMRKYRIDELPQFWNVIKGDMSIVGPRAERKYFADQISAVAPHYRHIYRVKPGITSLGMVKYGYASTVEEMVRRLKYDIIYIENMNIFMDIKIMIYTVLTVLTGRGK